MKYFAYGSNMSLRRLLQRVPSAQRLATCRLYGHQLRFHKRGRDGSAKCDAFMTNNPEHRVFGALFALAPQEKWRLDRAEGLGVGYQQKPVQVCASDGRIHEAFTYVALQIDSGLNPYQWYLEHVLIGARESQLPAAYQAELRVIEALDDPEVVRAREERAIYRVAELARIMG
ncbi:gamma-glutamylcyclotransferase family protein [Ferrimonas balearica]|uniref:gamma-glutamylcyclotransferase family protein n=1 Tax=Ferrimonas balearica TaxID=44012 RepID=UPI001C99542F|nr:gamma-glutamylcyclotransferase family protein [Ferrimonas balearica]MBY5922306.1 gamma-glutamylcyclotransferase [Ferrimonas balearica]MBY5994354.1 gamma-glutamylcyclotransferase [Ferrimonas balearica]